VRRISRDLADGYDEELEMEIEDRHPLPGVSSSVETDTEKDYRRIYFQQLFRLQAELVKLQDWVVASGQKVLILFEGRDAAGKGGAIKRISQKLNPRVCRVVALPAPNDRERTQWYFQRYVSHLPAAGEIVLFDRSWYNRAGVERVMGFCTPEEYEEFFRAVPEFERMLVRSGIMLLKYWFSITDEEQYLRFLGRIHDPLKQWKLSPMDLKSRRRWEDYTKAKEVMLERSHIPEARWWVVRASTSYIICCSSFPTQTRRNRWLCCQNANITSITLDKPCRRTCLFRRCIKRHLTPVAFCPETESTPVRRRRGGNS
jgi:polyphosphate kinase 2